MEEEYGDQTLSITTWIQDSNKYETKENNNLDCNLATMHKRKHLNNTSGRCTDTYPSILTMTLKLGMMVGVD